MAEAVDGGDADAEGHGAQARALPVERMRRRIGVGQAARADRKGDEAKRHVDGEQPGPGAEREDAGGDRRADRGGDRDHQRVDADAAAEQRMRIGEAHQRRIYAQDSGGAEALQDAGDRQQQQRVRQRAEGRGEGEQHEAGEIDAAIADDLAERSQRQQRDRDGELIAVDDPDREGRAGIEIVRDRRQGDIGDGAVHHRHDDAERNRDDGPVALRQRQAVRVFGHAG